MSLPYSPSRAVYQGNGAATSFPFAFKIWSTDQLDVRVTSPEGVSSQAQGWTASLSECGGSVTYLHEAKPLPASWRLVIMRAMPFAQNIDLVSASRFDPQVIEDGLDQAAAERQELNEKIARAVILPATSDQSPEELVASIYASRDAAASSASTAQTAATAAAASASTAQSTMQTATAAAVSEATAQASAAANSAAAAAQSAEEAADAVPENLLQRVTDTEAQNTEQDARLETAESKNGEQDARLDDMGATLAGKANADLNNVATLPQALLKAALNASGNAPAYACRAWVDFDGTGTVSIRASGNISSITDNGAGDYTANFATAMPHANYCPVGYFEGVYQGVFNGRGSFGNPSASSYRFKCVAVPSGAVVDVAQVNLAVFA